MPLLLKKKPKPLSFAAKVKTAVKSGKAAAPANFKARQQEAVDDRRQTERWSFARDGGGQLTGLSVSAIEKWLECREQFRLERCQGFRGFVGKPAIDFGELWHWLLGRHYSSKHKRDIDPMKDLAVGCRLFEQVLRRDNPSMSDKRRDAIQLHIAKTRALWPVYLEKYGEEDAKKDWMHVEEEWEFGYSLPPLKHVVRDNIKLEEVFKGNAEFEKSRTIEVVPGCVVNLRGIFDGLFRRDGRLWLLETKTKGRIDDSEIEDTLPFDIQTMTYLYACFRMFKEWPAGVSYNVIRNPQTEPHKRNAETLDEYVERLEGEVRKDEDHYFKRWELELGQEDIERYLDKQLDPILRDIQLWAYGFAPHYVHTKALNGKYGRCDMYDPITKGDFTGVERVAIKKKER